MRGPGMVSRPCRASGERGCGAGVWNIGNALLVRSVVRSAPQTGAAFSLPTGLEAFAMYVDGITVCSRGRTRRTSPPRPWMPPGLMEAGYNHGRFISWHIANASSVRSSSSGSVRADRKTRTARCPVFSAARLWLRPAPGSSASVHIDSRPRLAAAPLPDRQEPLSLKGRGVASTALIPSEKLQTDCEKHAGKEQEGERGCHNGTHTGREAPNRLRDTCGQRAGGGEGLPQRHSYGARGSKPTAGRHVSKAQTERRAWRCTPPHVCPAALGSCGVLACRNRRA